MLSRLSHGEVPGSQTHRSLEPFFARQWLIGNPPPGRCRFASAKKRRAIGSDPQTEAMMRCLVSTLDASHETILTLFTCGPPSSEWPSHVRFSQILRGPRSRSPGRAVRRNPRQSGLAINRPDAPPRSCPALHRRPESPPTSVVGTTEALLPTVCASGGDANLGIARRPARVRNGLRQYETRSRVG